MANVTFHDKPVLATLSNAVEFAIWDTTTSSAKRMSGDTVKRAIVNPSSVTASGTDQSGATVLGIHELHVVSSVAAGAGTKFAALSAGLEGTHKLIRVPASTNLLLHYPPFGGKINEQSANTPIEIEPGTTAEFYSVSTVDWITVP